MAPGINYEELELVLAEIRARDERDERREVLRQQLERYRAERLDLRTRTKAARALAKARSSAPTLASMSYPYIRVVSDEHSDLMLVNSIVPRGMEGREDVCQEVMIALWERRFSIDDLRANKGSIREFMAAFRRDNFEGGGYAVSLDEPRVDGRSWHDFLVDPSTIQESPDAML